jgi:hypothetical protein
MILPFDYIGYKRLSENKRFPNHRWYSDATWGENGWMVSIYSTRMCFAKFWSFYLRHQHIWHASGICTMEEEHRIYTDILFFVLDLDLLWWFIRFKWNTLSFCMNNYLYTTICDRPWDFGSKWGLGPKWLFCIFVTVIYPKVHMQNFIGIYQVVSEILKN